ncbi:MAG: VWA domain-containing protein [Phycisphaerae bacterium]
MHRRAAVMVQSVLFGGMVGVGVAALAVDTGLMYSAKQELQSAADAAALAAASQLGTIENAADAAIQEASRFANLNKIMGEYADLMQTDVVFGHAVMAVGSADKFDFIPNEEPYDAVRVTLRRDRTAADGPVSLLFATTFGMDGATMQASATAMLVPRDIGLVIDLSGSMNDDSELRHYQNFPSESGGTRPGVQINLKRIWAALPIDTGRSGIRNGEDPPSPGPLSSTNTAPGTGPGTPRSRGGNPDPGPEPSGGSANPAGPRWGWMTGFGENIVLGAYAPESDDGLYYIPRYTDTTDPDVIQNLIESGYTPDERNALLSAQYDNYSSRYRRRVRVLLGLSGWKSGKQHAKYHHGGNGNNRVDGNELTQTVSYPYLQGSWDSYINYVKSSYTRMFMTDTHLRYRYGIKTFVNYLLEQQNRHDRTPELTDTPEEPLFSVKNSVQAMIDEIILLQTQDHVSLETFGQFGTHREDLTNPQGGQSLPVALQMIADSMYGFQAGHDTVYTNIGAGLDMAIEELTSERARSSAAKVIIMLTDGKPNVNQYNATVGNNHPAAISWAMDRAAAAKGEGMTVYSVGVGGDVNEELCIDIATSPDHYYFADNAPDPDNNGEPRYVNQLRDIFRTLGGKRPVRLIQ